VPTVHNGLGKQRNVKTVLFWQLIAVFLRREISLLCIAVYVPGVCANRDCYLYPWPRRRYCSCWWPAPSSCSSPSTSRYIQSTAHFRSWTGHLVLEGRGLLLRFHTVH